MELQRLNNPEPLLTLTKVRLNYGTLRVLEQIDLSLERAKVYALVGEHGAGKSSLARIISGLVKPQAGQLVFDDKTYSNLNLKTALELGVEMVHQHTLSLNPYFSIAENFALDSTPNYKLRSRKKNLAAAQEFLTQYEIDLDPTMPVKNLAAADQIFVDILKHIYARPRLFILDEALEKLTAPAFQKIITMLKTLQQAGVTMLLITHRIDDIYNLADKVSIIKHGAILVTDDVKNIDKINLIKMAYTQVSNDPSADDLNEEFYQLLKYNEAILRNLPVNLIVADQEQRIKLVNDSCEQNFDLVKIPYLNAPIMHLLSGTNQDILDFIDAALTSKEEKALYQVLLTFNQIKVMSNVRTFPIYDGAFFIGNIIIIEDVTEYDRLQKQVILSEKLASVGLLAAGVAHEINNPLEIIYTYLSYMKYRFRTPEFHEALDTLHEQVADIASIVSNLQSFSDHTRGAIDEIELNDTIRTMLNLIQHNARHKQINIRFEPYQQDLLIKANKHEIKQVLLNLFKNSFEAMPAGGEIFITTRQQIENGAPYAQILFQDTGPGICDDNPNNIFLPFYSTKKGAEQNMGLGLSVSYGIVKKYHGTITIENPGEAGCQFLIQFPQMSASEDSGQQ